MVVYFSCVGPVCKPVSEVGPVVPEPPVQGHCTLSCIFYFILIERKSEESPMHGVFLLRSHFSTQLVEHVENMLDFGDCLNVN